MNNIILIIEHIPFHNTYGVNIQTPEPIIKKYNIEDNSIINLKDFKIQILNINENNVKLKVFDNKGILSSSDADFNINYKDVENVGNVAYNKKFNLYKHVYDAGESWALIFKKK